MDSLSVFIGHALFKLHRFFTEDALGTPLNFWRFLNVRHDCLTGRDNPYDMLASGSSLSNVAHGQERVPPCLFLGEGLGKLSQSCWLKDSFTSVDGLSDGDPGFEIIQSHAAHPQAVKLLFSSQTSSRRAIYLGSRTWRQRSGDYTPSTLRRPMVKRSIGAIPRPSMAHKGREGEHATSFSPPSAFRLGQYTHRADIKHGSPPGMG